MKHNPGALAKALYSNTPEATNELLFRKGDILTVIEYDYDGQPGWWLCAHRGQRGICPSNYLELLEDKYSLRTSSSLLQQSLSQSQSGSESGEISESAPGLIRQEGEGKLHQELEQQQQEDFDPLETYDVPRSCVQNLSKSSNLVGESTANCLAYSNQPLYQNDEPLSPLTKTSPLDLYDVPRSQLPIYGQSLARIRKYGYASEASLASSGNSFHNNSNLNSSSTRSSSSGDLGLPPSGNSRSNRSSPINSNKFSSTSSISNISTIPGNSAQNSENRSISQTSGTSQVQLRHPYNRQQNYPNTSSGITINHSNRSSIQSESAESGIVMVSSPPMQDLYDVPRSALAVQVSSNSNGTSSRPQSSLSISSSGMGLSIANSDSKDSLDLYDVPRSAKSYVNHMETKYDQVQSRHGSTASLARDQSTHSIPGHSRHNSTSSIFSAYGYTRQGQGSSRSVPSADFTDGPKQSLGMNFGSRNSVASGSSSINAQNYPSNDLYDVPRSNCPPPPNPRTNRLGVGASTSGSIGSFKSQVSLISEGDAGDYDVPSSFTRKVSLCDSTETLSCQETFGNEASELKLGASSSSLSSSSSNHLRSVSQCNNNNDGNNIGAASGTSGSSDVKILPLGPKAAVSVCEKLRHEVVTTITTILDHVKPKWRSKENLMEIMPELRFSCVRLSLAIKDIADFASRSMSNAKKLGDETLVTKLYRLLTPVMNGSQIVQRDVDELEAYFWSVDRLSVAPGRNHQQDKNISGDALDQLILCARSLKHDVTEMANFLALNSSTLFRENDRPPPPARISTQMVEATVEDTQEDYDYVSLMSTAEAQAGASGISASSSKPPPVPVSVQMPQLDSRDQQLLEFYSSQISITAPLLSQSISTFISAIHQNEPPESFNVHLKYVILMAYKMLFAGDTVHRNVNNEQLKGEIESKANDLHKSILSLYEASKVATVEFPKIAPMQSIVDKVWSTTQSATQLKKVIFNATCTSL